MKPEKPKFDYPVVAQELADQLARAEESIATAKRAISSRDGDTNRDVFTSAIFVYRAVLNAGLDTKYGIEVFVRNLVGQPAPPEAKDAARFQHLVMFWVDRVHSRLAKFA